jgi:hypothetical protein
VLGRHAGIRHPYSLVILLTMAVLFELQLTDTAADEYLTEYEISGSRMPAQWGVTAASASFGSSSGPILSSEYLTRMSGGKKRAMIPNHLSAKSGLRRIVHSETPSFLWDVHSFP